MPPRKQTTATLSPAWDDRTLYSNIYYLDRATGTFADALAAIGLANLFAAALRAGHLESEVIIIDDGPCYRIELAESITPELVDGLSGVGILEPLDLVQMEKNAAKLMVAMRSINYAGERGRNAEYFELRNVNRDLL